jgi:hypothetical protein
MKAGAKLKPGGKKKEREKGAGKRKEGGCGRPKGNVIIITVVLLALFPALTL